MWIDLLIFAVAVIFAVYAITCSAVFAAVRIFWAAMTGPFLGVLLFCPVCTGFWAGIGVGAVMHPFFSAARYAGDWGAAWWFPGMLAVVLIHGGHTLFGDRGFLSNGLYEHELQTAMEIRDARKRSK